MQTLFQHLGELSLENNELSGELPKAIGSMLHLGKVVMMCLYSDGGSCGKSNKPHFTSAFAISESVAQRVPQQLDWRDANIHRQFVSTPKCRDSS